MAQPGRVKPATAGFESNLASDVAHAHAPAARLSPHVHSRGQFDGVVDRARIAEREPPARVRRLQGDTIAPRRETYFRRLSTQAVVPGRLDVNSRPASRMNLGASARVVDHKRLTGRDRRFERDGIGEWRWAEARRAASACQRAASCHARGRGQDPISQQRQPAQRGDRSTRGGRQRIAQ